MDTRAKNSLVPITEKLKIGINELFKRNVCDNEAVPNAICSGCKRNLYRNKIIELPNLDEFNKLVRTRSKCNAICNCKICDMVISSPQNRSGKSDQIESNIVPKPITKEVCSQCFAVVCTADHDCTSSDRNKDILALSQLSSKQRDHIIAYLIKQKIVESGQPTNELTNIVTTISQRHGKPLRVAVNSDYEKLLADSKSPMLSADFLKMVMTNFNFTQNTTLGLASMIRAETRKRKIVESHIKEKLSAATHCVDHFFISKSFEFESTKKNVTTSCIQTAVICNDVENFVEFVKVKRQVRNPHLKIGFDSGGGFLKICISIQSTEEDAQHTITRQRYTDGVNAKRFKDSGVKKLFILGIAESTQENYNNVSKMWYSLNMQRFRSTIAVDLKLANIMSGIMSHSSSFPCTWCFTKKDDLAQCGELRSIGNILYNYTSVAVGLSRDMQ